MNTSKFEKKKTVHVPQYFGKTKRENLSGLLFFKVNTKKERGNVTFNSYSFTDPPPPTPPPPSQIKTISALLTFNTEKAQLGKKCDVS